MRALGWMTTMGLVLAAVALPRSAWPVGDRGDPETVEPAQDAQDQDEKYEVPAPGPLFAEDSPAAMAAREESEGGMGSRIWIQADPFASPPPPKCPPGKPLTRIAQYQGCLQADGSIVTSNGFRIRRVVASARRATDGRAGGGGGGGAGTGAGSGDQDVSVTPPSGGGAEVLDQLDEGLERDADQLEQKAKAQNAGFERFAQRQAAEFQRALAQSLRDLEQGDIVAAQPAPGARPAASAPAPTPSDRELEAWCAAFLPRAQAADRYEQRPILKPSELPAIPPPPTLDYFDCIGCSPDKLERHLKDAKAWVQQRWYNEYIAEDREMVKLAHEHAQQAGQIDERLRQGALGGTACARLQALPSLQPGADDMTRLSNRAIARYWSKVRKLRRDYGKRADKDSFRPFALAMISSLKELQLLSCYDGDMSGNLGSLHLQMGDIWAGYRKRLVVDRDYRVLGMAGFLLGFSKEIDLISNEPIDGDEIVKMLNAAQFRVTLDFSVKFGGQGPEGSGYALARVKGSGLMYAYSDPKDAKCGLLESARLEDGYRFQAEPLTLTVVNAEVFGSKYKNTYLGPAKFKSHVVIDLPCCRKSGPTDVAYVFLEALGAQQARRETERWSRPQEMPVPMVDNWFRAAFNAASLKRMAESGQAEAEGAALEGKMAQRVAEMEALQARFERGEVGMADVVAAAMKLQQEVSGASATGQDSVLAQAQHFRLVSPFRNLQESPIKVRLDAHQIAARNDAEVAAELRDTLVYGIGSIELRHTVKAVPAKPWTKATIVE